MQAIILAGGYGTRLRPLTEQLPKPMIPVLNKPLMEYTIELLKKHDVTDIGVSLMFLPNFIESHFGDGSEYGVKIKYIKENEPLGSAGCVKLASNELDESFIVISGDALTNVDLKKIFAYHKSMNADVTLVLSKQNEPLEFGVVLTDSTGKVTSFSEKPNWESVLTNTVNTGIYIINKRVLDKVPENKFFDFSKDLFPLLLNEGYNLYGYITVDYWRDMGTPQSYLDGQKDVLNGRFDGRIYENIVGENVKISEETKLVPPVFIGNNTILVGKNMIGPNVVLGENCYLSNANVIDSLVWNNTALYNSLIKHTLIGENTRIDKVSFGGRNLIGSNVTLSNNVCLKHGTTVFNDISIVSSVLLEGEVTSGNISNQTLWSDGSVIGLWNHEITPSVLEGIAASYRGEKILVCANKTDLSNAISNLLASYLAVMGSDVYITNAYEGSARFFCCANRMKGIFVYESNENISIQLMNERGINISHQDEKKISFSKKCNSTSHGKIIRLNSIDKDFEYFLNASMPFTRSYVQVHSNERLKLHNVVWADGEYSGNIKNMCSAAIVIKNNVITDVYTQDGRISSVAFMRLKIDISLYLGAKKVFLPPYVPDEIKAYAQQNSIEILNTLQHKGDSMELAGRFNTMENLLEYVPLFFAQALSYYFSKNKYDQSEKSVIARYDFSVAPSNALQTIFAFNKDKSNDFIKTQYKNSVITVLPRNNGYSFTAYGHFLNEEYGADILEGFVKENLSE